MSEKKIQPVILSQLEDVLEERQKSDRRKENQETTKAIEADRRKQARRDAK